MRASRWAISCGRSTLAWDPVGRPRLSSLQGCPILNHLEVKDTRLLLVLSRNFHTLSGYWCPNFGTTGLGTGLENCWTSRLSVKALLQ